VILATGRSAISTIGASAPVFSLSQTRSCIPTFLPLTPAS
jgi:hypothetical protein